MNRHRRELLQLVRDAENPTRADEERVLRSLHAAVAAGVTSPLGSASQLGSALERSWFGTARAKLGAFGSKLSVVAACTGAALGTADTPSASAPTLSEGVEPHAARWVEAVTSASEPVTSVSPSAPGASQSVTSVSPSAPGASQPATGSAERVGGAAVLAPRAKARSASNRPPASSPRRMHTLGEELELLQRVQAALKRRDGQAALRELDSAGTQGGELSAERHAARVLGLCLLGRVAEARRVAADFAERHPESVQREAIASSCANRARIGDP